MDKKTFRKYNLGSPRRASRRKKHSGFEKYKIGPPRRPSSEMELTEVLPSIITFSTPIHPYREEMKHITPKTPKTPKTPRTAVWEKWKKEGKLGYMGDYEEDEDDKRARIKRAKLGIISPKTYTTFEGIQTPFMTEAHTKKPLTDAIEEVDEEAWKRKKDDPPTRNPGKSLIGRMGRMGRIGRIGGIGGIGGIRGRRRYSRGRGRGRSRR